MLIHVLLEGDVVILGSNLSDVHGKDNEVEVSENQREAYQSLYMKSNFHVLPFNVVHDFLLQESLPFIS